MNAEKKAISKKQKLATAILVLVILALSAGMWLYRAHRLQAGSALSSQDLLVVIEAEGEQLYAVPLSDDNELPVLTGRGENIVQIKDGIARVESADCKNQICVHSQPISHPGETIVCLPHRVVVSITVRSSLQP